MSLAAGRVLRLLAAASLAPAVAAAQVGHPPAKSPYTDIVRGHSWSFLAGSFGGNGGKLGIGPHDGTLFGLRYDIRVSTPIQFGIAVGRAGLKRLIVNADDSVATRVRGPVSQSVTFTELDLQFNLTGKKAWHRLAPYAGSGFGLAFGSGTSADSSGYKFGTKLYLAPNLGVRFFLSDRLHLRAEARQTFWKLKYPRAYGDEPAQDPGTSAQPHAVIPDGKFEQWTGGRVLILGIGYSLSL